MKTKFLTFLVTCFATLATAANATISVTCKNPFLGPSGDALGSIVFQLDTENQNILSIEGATPLWCLRGGSRINPPFYKNYWNVTRFDRNAIALRVDEFGIEQADGCDAHALAYRILILTLDRQQGTLTFAFYNSDDGVERKLPMEAPSTTSCEIIKGQAF